MSLSNQTELLKLLCMSDEEMIELFLNKYRLAYLPYEMEYRWKKRLSIYSKSNTVSHEYRWLVEALKYHSQEEMLLLRKEIETIYKNEIEGENERKEPEKKEIKKIQSCPTFSRPSASMNDVNEALEKTVNGC